MFRWLFFYAENFSAERQHRTRVQFHIKNSRIKRTLIFVQNHGEIHPYKVKIRGRNPWVSPRIFPLLFPIVPLACLLTFQHLWRPNPDTGSDRPCKWGETNQECVLQGPHSSCLVCIYSTYCHNNSKSVLECSSA